VSTTSAAAPARRWKRVEYDRLVEQGFFEGERLELLDGALIVREPQGTPHATALELAGDALRAAFGPGWRVRTRLPLALDDETEPEPDVVVVPGRPRDYLAEHPSRPVLIVEIASSSLEFDRRDKGALYARAAVADYWIVNLVDRRLEVHRAPGADPEAPYGWRYLDVTAHGPGASVAPLALQAASILVADLLP
jgi:Uma2 family endonuclease